MTFATPYLLLVLVAVPLLLGAYLLQLRRRRKQAVRYSNVSLVKAAAGPTRRWRRHVPIALVLASLALLGAAAARPQVRMDVPLSSSTVILALDVSGSMCSTDVAPNRLTAAQAAVRTFVEQQGGDTKIGLILFSGFAQLAVAPTTEHDDVLTALDAATTGRGTTIGAAILKSLDAIAELDPNVAPSDQGDAPNPDGSSLPKDGSTTGSGSQGGTGTQGGTGSQGGTVEKGSAPEIVVLLTDGANTRGITPEDAAKQAAARGVRVYPIGFGTTNPTSMVCTRQQLGGLDDQFGGFRGGFPGGFGGGASRSFLVVDEDALRTVADTTGGEYFGATDADQLTSVLNDLPKRVSTQQQDVDVSAAFVAAAVLLLLVGLGLSLRWTTLNP